MGSSEVDGSRVGDEFKVDKNKELEMDHNFDDLKYKIGKGTKDMVNKIFKAAHDDNARELESLLDQIEKRAKDMCKPSVLPDMPPPRPEKDGWRQSQHFGSHHPSEGPMLIEENAPGSNL